MRSWCCLQRCSNLYNLLSISGTAGHCSAQTLQNGKHQISVMKTANVPIQWNENFNNTKLHHQFSYFWIALTACSQYQNSLTTEWFRKVCLALWGEEDKLSFTNVVLPWLRMTEHVVGTLVSFSERTKSRILVFKQRRPVHQREKEGRFQSFLPAMSIWCHISPGRFYSLAQTSVALKKTKQKSVKTFLFELFQCTKDKQLV